MKIGEELVQQKIITPEQLNEALELQKKQPEKKIGEILIKLGYVDIKQLMKAMDKN